MIEVLKQALEVLEYHVEHFDSEQYTSICELDPAKDAITSLRQAIAEAEKAKCDGGTCGLGGYCDDCPKTQQRTWVDLTDDEMLMIYGQQHEGKKYSLGRMVQQALKEKNT